MSTPISTSQATTQPVSLSRYIWAFMGVTLAIGVVLFLIEAMAHVNIPAGASIGASIAAVYLAAQMFVKDNRRPLLNVERKRFALWTLLWSGLLAIPFGALGVFGEMSKNPGKMDQTLRDPMFWGIMGASLAFGFLIGYFVVYYCLGSFSNKLAAKLPAPTA
jgi:hypothetical protein